MIRSELILIIAEEKQLPIDVATAVVDTFFASITRRLAAGGRVEIRGFGSFSVRERGPAVVRNPKTGAKSEQPARMRQLFRMSTLLLMRLNPNLPASAKTNKAGRTLDPPGRSSS